LEAGKCDYHFTGFVQGSAKSNWETNVLTTLVGGKVIYQDLSSENGQAAGSK
jgi:hypothetical protein